MHIKYNFVLFINSTMLSLYFNCKLTKQKLIPENIDSGYFYPVTYPRKSSLESFDQYTILIKTIISYSVLKFETAIFNIDIEGIDEHDREDIKNIIAENYSTSKTILKFSRPSTVEEWKRDVANTSNIIKKNSPVLVVMNHDHPFVDYATSAFNTLLADVFPESENNHGKALYYSHALEVISWAVNGRGKIKFKKQNGGIYKSEVINTWIDAICVMTMETLSHIWSRIKFTGSYIGRLDWVGAEYSRLALTTYVFPREFFKHFDGYGHVTGMRLISEVGTSYTDAMIYPSNSDFNGLLLFYYQRWIDTHLLSIRDFLNKERYSVVSLKSIYIKAVEESLYLFKIGYFEADISAGLIDKNKMIVVEAALRNHIYYQGNLLFEVIKTDVSLIRGDLITEFKIYIESLPNFGLALLRRILSRILRFFI